MTGILNNLDLNLTECQGLVLAPTRELAQQIEKVMRALGDYQQVRMAWDGRCWSSMGMCHVRPLLCIAMAAARAPGMVMEQAHTFASAMCVRCRRMGMNHMHELSPFPHTKLLVAHRRLHTSHPGLEHHLDGSYCTAPCHQTHLPHLHGACFLTPQVKCHACVGGTSVREDARILGAGVHVVVGTPGRVYDMLRRRCLRADNIKVCGVGACASADPATVQHPCAWCCGAAKGREPGRFTALTWLG